ncbi:hypothetical protein BYT27DRAFT_7334778 [Phlegmacium glaucopus]|nr:hypothetical protein BYT27DRAFT_7334778 [Phlegmacium glaucopus]
MTTIDIIPPEILVKIFSASFFLNDNADVIISPYQGPLLISQISRKWRHVALSDSQLWSSLSIKITPSKQPNISMLRLWLKRSSSQLLSFTIIVDQFSLLNPESVLLSQSTLQELAAESHRWKRITMFLPGSQQLLHGLFTHGAPNLESASFQLGHWKTDEISDINRILYLSPSLKILDWSNRATQWTSFDNSFDSGLGNLQVSWNNLTDVDLNTWITWKTALDILRRCSNIVNCNLHHFGYGPDGESNEVCSPVLLNYLSSLGIYQLELDNSLAALLDKLTCPALRHFHFTCGFIKFVAWPQLSFLDFLVRSACHLYTLLLEYTAIEEDQLLQCLRQSSSSLICLKVYSNAAGSICIGDKVLDQLRRRSTTFVQRGSLADNAAIKDGISYCSTPLYNMHCLNTRRQSSI